MCDKTMPQSFWDFVGGLHYSTHALSCVILPLCQITIGFALPLFSFLVAHALIEMIQAFFFLAISKINLPCIDIHCHPLRTFNSFHFVAHYKPKSGKPCCHKLFGDKGLGIVLGMDFKQVWGICTLFYERSFILVVSFSCDLLKRKRRRIQKKKKEKQKIIIKENIKNGSIKKIQKENES